MKRKKMNELKIESDVDKLFARRDISWHCKSVLLRVICPVEGKSAVLKNPRLLFDKQIGKRLLI